MRFAFAIFLGFCALTLAGSPSLAVEAKKEIQPVEIWTGDLADLKKPEFLVLRTQEEWRDAWMKTDKKQVLKPLDKGQMAIALFAGTKTTSGHLIEIKDIVDNFKTITVTYRVAKPNEYRPAGPYVTSPWLIAIVPYSDEPVVFKAQESTFVRKIKGFFVGIWDFFDRLLFSGLYDKPQK